MNAAPQICQACGGRIAEPSGEHVCEPCSSALAILTDLIEDPHNNGDYRLNISGDDLSRLWRAIETELSQLTKANADLAITLGTLENEREKLAQSESQSDERRIRIMELDRALDAMHARAEKAEADGAALWTAALQFVGRSTLERALKTTNPIHDY